MQLNRARTLKELLPVVKDKSSVEHLSPDEVIYWMFNHVQEQNEGKWFNLTMTTPKRLGGEFAKTFGHYHSTNEIETYKLLSGTGLFVLQKRKVDNGKELDNVIETLYLVKLKVGEEIDISPQWGHSWSNVGNEPLITLDNWIYGHKEIDYKSIEKLQGMAVYITLKNGEVEITQNKNYQLLSAPQVLSLEEFKQKV